MTAPGSGSVGRQRPNPAGMRPRGTNSVGAQKRAPTARAPLVPDVPPIRLKPLSRRTGAAARGEHTERFAQRAFKRIAKLSVEIVGRLAGRCKAVEEVAFAVRIPQR